jgi:uncharacterized protein with NAD-binding domain and iron-sulfur cluster
MTDVTIVGGGLAGMAAAHRLLQRGCKVTLFEADQRLGGKAGADSNGDGYDDHGFHIFLPWYLNTWRLVDELGIRNHFVDFMELGLLRAGEFPQVSILHGLTSRRYFFRNLTSGFLPLPQMFLVFYALWDLASQPYNRRAALDQVSMFDFLRSRFYAIDELAVLKTMIVPSYYISAMTVRNYARYWLKHSRPVVRILRGNLHEFFIRPWQCALRDLGCTIHTGSRLMRVEVQGSRVTRLHFNDEKNNRTYARDAQTVVLAVPHHSLATILDEPLCAAAPSLSKVRHLRSQPMAALHIYCNRKIQGLPATHVILIDSQFGLSFIDVSQTWQGYPGTVLNVIAADCTGLATLSQERAARTLVEELKRFVPTLETADIQKMSLRSHTDAPLFGNDAGAWQFRPAARTEVRNLYLAGDYCRSHVDIACMEGAISAGLLAAEAVRSDAGLVGAIDILQPAVFPQWLFALAKAVGLPIAALAKCVTQIADSAQPLCGLP